MKAAQLVIILYFMAIGPALASGCDRSKFPYIQEEEARGASEIFLVPVPPNFSPSNVNVLQTYKSISVKMRPTYICSMAGMNGQGAFKEITCKLLSNGRVFSPWGGEAIEIGRDGNTSKANCWDDTTSPCLEDSSGTRISADPLFVRRPYANPGYNTDYVISGCETGTIDVIQLWHAFAGYAMVVRTRQTGFVNTYSPTPTLRF